MYSRMVVTWLVKIVNAKETIKHVALRNLCKLLYLALQVHAEAEGSIKLQKPEELRTV